MATLLNRIDFKNQVFKRQNNKCAFCGEPAVDAHHILERKLFEDGGYYLDNGIAVCAKHHLMLERDEITVQEARDSIEISVKILPENFKKDLEYDKWGNIIKDEHSRLKGPIFDDDGCQKALKLKLWMFEN